MGNGQTDGRFAPPQAHVEDVAVPRDGIELASRASRFFALLLDSRCLHDQIADTIVVKA